MDHHEHRHELAVASSQSETARSDTTSAHGAGHDRHEGHSVAMFRDRFWLTLALTIPVVILQSRHPGMVRLFGAGLPGRAVSPRDPRDRHLLLRRLGLPPRRQGRAGRSAARDDDPHLAGDRRGLRDLLGRHPRLVRRRDLVELATLITVMLLGHWLEMRSIAQARGALAALAELLPDTRRARDRDRHRAGPDRRAARRGHRARAPRRADACRRPGRRGQGRRRRVDDHRRIPGRAQGPGDTVMAGTVAGGGTLRVKVTATGDHDGPVGDRASRRRRPGFGFACPGARRSRRRLLFYVALAAGTITLFFWWASPATRRAPWCGRRRSSSSPAPMPWVSRSRSSSPSRRPSAPGTGYWSRTVSRSSGPATSTSSSSTRLAR